MSCGLSPRSGSMTFGESDQGPDVTKRVLACSWKDRGWRTRRPPAQDAAARRGRGSYPSLPCSCCYTAAAARPPAQAKQRALRSTRAIAHLPDASAGAHRRTCRITALTASARAALSARPVPRAQWRSPHLEPRLRRVCPKRRAAPTRRGTRSTRTVSHSVRPPTACACLE